MSRSLEGSVFRTPDGKRWFARLRYTDAAGAHKEKKRTVRTHAQAVAKITELKREAESDKAVRKTYAQLDRFFREQYVHTAKIVGGKKVSGFRQDLRIVRRYLDSALMVFGSMYLDEITYEHLRQYRDMLHARPDQRFKSTVKTAGASRRVPRARSVSDVNQNLRRLRRVFNVAIEQGWLAINPFKRGRPLIIESFEVERTRTLSVAEETRLVSACKLFRKHLIPIIIFAIETGLRLGEMKKLRWSDVNLAGRSIRVAGESSKTLRWRLAPMSERTAKVLAEQWQNSRRRQSDLVFGASDFKRAFNSACRAAKLSDVHFHDLRHTAITRWLEKGISVPLAMKAAGHSQMKTFLRYVNQSETSVFEFSQKLDRAA